MYKLQNVGAGKAFFLVLVFITAGAVLGGEDHREDDRFVPRIAVVNVREVIADSDRWADFQDQHQLRREEAEEVLRDYQNRLSMLRVEYENLPPGTERTERKRQEIQELSEEFQQKEREISREFQEYGIAGLSRIYRALTDIVELYARENDLDLVLKKSQIDLVAGDLQELEVFERSDVLYSGPGLDISADIADLFNGYDDGSE